jgi:uncharacterized Tic20 family protein
MEHPDEKDRPGQEVQEIQETVLDNKTSNWGMFAHLSALLMLLGVPFGHILGPFVVWLVKRREIPFVDEQGKESMNFQISMTIYGLIAALLILVVIGIPILILLAVMDMVYVIIASVRTSNGEHYRYPFNLRLVK